MNWTLEVVRVPVSDVDAAVTFYRDGLGFNLDFDLNTAGALRVVQLTPPGSGCSIQVGRSSMPPGSQRDLQLVVRDLITAHAELTARGVSVSQIMVFDERGQQRPHREGDELNNNGFMYFKDPEGNSWAIQQITDRV